MTETIMNISEYCRHRGISRKNFYQHYDKGNVKDDCFKAPPGSKRPLIIMERADAALDKNARKIPGGEATKRKFKGETPAKQEPEAITDSEIRRYLAEDIESLENLDMAELQRRAEIEKILAARLKRRQTAREVIDAGEVQKKAYESGRAIKEQLSGIPDRTGALVAAVSDDFECRQIIRKEIDFILDGLSEILKVPDPGS